MFSRRSGSNKYLAVRTILVDSRSLKPTRAIKKGSSYWEFDLSRAKRKENYPNGNKNHLELAGFRVIEGSSYRQLTEYTNKQRMSLQKHVMQTHTKIDNLCFAVPPSLTTTPVDQTIIEGATVTFHCTATGNPIPKITWTKDGKAVGLGNILSFETNRNQSGKYWCSAGNGLNVIVNASADLDVLCKCTATL